jgi:hypothetical protein
MNFIQLLLLGLCNAAHKISLFFFSSVDLMMSSSPWWGAASEAASAAYASVDKNRYNFSVGHEQWSFLLFTWSTSVSDIVCITFFRPLFLLMRILESSCRNLLVENNFALVHIILFVSSWSKVRWQKVFIYYVWFSYFWNDCQHATITQIDLRQHVCLHRERHVPISAPAVCSNFDEQFCTMR